MKLFEVSWEVCNKVGGIYTVLSTKAKYIKKFFGKDYFLIGPFLKDTIEFRRKKLPEWLENINDKLSKRGIKINYGIWNIEGFPQVILLDFYEFFNNEKNFWKYKFWEWFKVDSLYSDYTFDEPFLWSISVGLLLEEIDRVFNETKILHAHEWLSGGTILYVKKMGLNYKTIFTTHGTVLGRTISSNNIDFFKIMDKIDPNQEAYKYWVHFKHQLEKETVRVSDIFTTVSDVIAKECEFLFNRRPDKIIYNGINIKNKDILGSYYLARKWIREFIYWYFYPYYYFDLENTIFIYTIGRYEFYNKGYDLIIDLLEFLNKNIDFNIVFFFFVPAGTVSINKKVIRNYEKYLDIKEEIYNNFPDIIGDLLIKIKYKKKQTNVLCNVIKEIHNLCSEDLPSIVTHELLDKKDFILKKLDEKGLDNNPNNKVKVVYVPVYLGQDIIFNLEPERLLPGFDIGIFLSRYEPFGYTGLEALSLGIPIILSNKTGFYKAIYNIHGEKIRKVILEFNIDDIENSKEKAMEFINKYYDMDLEERFKLKAECINLAESFYWENISKEYISIYQDILK